MFDDAKLVTIEYARQIISAVKETDAADVHFLVGELLREYGAKAYRQGREHLAAEMVNRV